MTASDRREILPTNVVPRHYKLSLTPDFKTFKYSGNVSVDIDVVESTSSIILNALELEVHSACVDVKGKTIQSMDIKVDEEIQTTTITFAQNLSAGINETKLNIAFTGTLNDKMAGFYRSSHIDAQTGEKKWLATTQMGIHLTFQIYD